MKWVTVKEAADQLGYSVNYFRELYCNAKKPLVTMRVKKGPTGRRRIEVLKADVDRINDSLIQRPA